MPGMYREFRFHPHLERFGPVAAPVASAAFARWTPCIGPVLGAVLGYAAKESDLRRGPARRLLARAGCRSSRSGSPWAGWPRRSTGSSGTRAITLASAAILAVFGVILLTDRLPEVTARLSDFLRDVGLERIVELADPDQGSGCARCGEPSKSSSSRPKAHAARRGTCR